MRCVGSYLWVRVHPPKDKSTLEGFVVSRFGWRLYGHFFKTQSEKVWGVPCTEIQADWGAQRIKNLSLFRAVWEALKPKRLRAKAAKSKQVTSLIEEFNYPKYGPGMMWERCAELVTAQGTKITFDATVTKVEHRDGKAVAVTADDRRCADPLRVHRRDLVDADRRAPARDGPAAARRRHRRGRRAPLPRLHHRRARRARGGRLPRQLDLHQRHSRSRSAASRTSAGGRRTWSRTGAPASASSSSCTKATTCGRRPTPT